MKILYTKKFKEILSQPWSNISLGGFKLREGTETGLTEITDFLPDNFNWRNRSTSRIYKSEIIKLSRGGIQIFLDIPEEDQSFYNESFSYQVIMFFYQDSSTSINDPGSLAFVCYEDIETTGDQGEVEFTNLSLTSRKNIITIPKFSWECNIKFSQSDVIEFLESPIGNLDVSPYLGDKYTSKDSWSAWKIDSLSDVGETPWIETTYINKYGIKIY